jgi:class 3 adenylate cyclase
MAVLLVDICGASDFIIDHHDLDVVSEQRRWISAMRRLGEAHGSASLKLLGDGCLIAFADPADGLAFARSLRATLTQSGLQIRAGVDIGRVELFDGEVIGQATFVAAELMRLALPGQIVMTGTFRALSGQADESESIGPRTLQATGQELELFAS